MANIKIRVQVITAAAKAAIKTFTDNVSDDFKIIAASARGVSDEIKEINKESKQAQAAIKDVGKGAKDSAGGFSAASKSAEAFQSIMTKVLIPIAIITVFFNMGKKIHSFFDGAINGADRFRKSLEETSAKSQDLVKNLRLEGVGEEQKKILGTMGQFNDLQTELNDKLEESGDTTGRRFLRQMGIRILDNKAQIAHEKETAKLTRDRSKALDIIAGQRAKELEIAIATNKEDQKSKVLTQIEEIDQLRQAEAESSGDFVKAQEIEERLEDARHQKRLDQIAKERKEQIEQTGPLDSEAQKQFDETVKNERIIFDLRMRNIEAETTERERKALELIEKETEKRLEDQKKLEQKMLEAAEKAAQRQADELEKELERISDSLLGLFGDGAFGDLTLLVQGLADVKNAIENGSRP